jgi:serine phosphatase RsbU (regulator of sigma subunit)
MAMLVRTEGSQQGKWVYSLGSRCALGRTPECEISDVFRGNTTASRLHAVLELVEGRYVVEDTGSRNGTYVNGQRVTGRTQLCNGDQLSIAGVEFRFLEDDDSSGHSSSGQSGDLGRIAYAEADESPSVLSSLIVAPPDAGSSLTGFSAERLRALVTMLKNLGRTLDIDATLNELLAGLFAIFSQAQHGFVAFIVQGQQDVIPRATHFRSERAGQQVRVSRQLVRHVVSRREAILWSDQGSAATTYRTLSDLKVCSALCAPLLDGDGNAFGVVQIDTDQPLHAFTSEDLEVMVGAVTQAAMAVRFARLHEESLRHHAIQRDLELARRVQLGLLPESYPDCVGFEFFAYYRAANEVGGDYYDFIELPRERIALVVADAAGKGVSAALMMAKVSGELKYHLSCASPGRALARMNDSLCASATERFVTLLAAILDRRSATLTIVNAGHPAPLRRRPNGIVEAVAESTRGTALGILPDREYAEATLPIEPGDLWMAYTDGFSEAFNSAGEMFGAPRLCERLAAAPGVLREAGESIVREVLQFQGNQPLSDDMCLVGWGKLRTAVLHTGAPGEVVLNAAPPTRIALTEKEGT